MVYISQKNKSRPRLQFTIRHALHDRYQSCLLQAKMSDLVIDFGHDFEEWLSGQLIQIESRLNDLKNQEILARSSDFRIDQTETSDGVHELHNEQHGGE